MDEYSREPCPWRIMDDCGGAFLMGAIGGGIFHSIKGFRNAPAGFNKRMVSYQYANHKPFEMFKSNLTKFSSFVLLLSIKIPTHNRPRSILCCDILFRSF